MKLALPGRAQRLGWRSLLHLPAAGGYRDANAVRNARTLGIFFFALFTQIV